MLGMTKLHAQILIGLAIAAVVLLAYVAWQVHYIEAPPAWTEQLR